MSKKILILGGTYFCGRVFAILAARAGYELTFLNRGRYSMKSLGENIREYRADRRDVDSLKNCGLSGDFDAVVDFCAYEPKDIQNVFEGLSISTGQYVYMSTADVYRREPGVKNEGSPRLEEMPEDEVSLYAYKKKLLEDELMQAAAAYGFSCTVIRPAFVYGPYNYAPREAMYIRDLIQKNPIYHPTDAKGQFQMVYVKDVAEAILAVIGQDPAGNRAYNLSAPEVLDYAAFLQLMKEVSGIADPAVIDVTVAEVLEQGLPLPFPLTEYESELFDGSLAVQELGIGYTPIREGMKKTYDSFRPVFEK